MKTVFLRDLEAIRNTVVTIGSFDGVHLGHQGILRTVAVHARSLRGTSVVLTFERHPRTLARRETVPLITSSRQQDEILSSLGIDRKVVVDDESFFSLSPEKFIDSLLAAKLGVREIVIGFNFRFGRGRAGTPEMLAGRGKLLGFRVNVHQPTRVSGKIVSSSLVRELLGDGQVSEAALCLGRLYEARGTVGKGDGRGSGLGFPTANIETELPLLVPYGVYRVDVSSPEPESALPAQAMPALASWGVRPTFGAGKPPVLEVHVPGFSGSLEGRFLHVAFRRRIRPEKKFAGPGELVQAMKEDLEKAAIE